MMKGLPSMTAILWLDWRKMSLASFLFNTRLIEGCVRCSEKKSWTKATEK